MTFLFTTDLHYGYERHGGHKVPIHDMKAWNATLAFAADLKPDVWIVGGDFLDCSCISHHTKGRPGQTEGLRLLADAEEGKKVFIKPIEDICKGEKIYIIGNHEAWLRDLTNEMPSLEGIVDLSHLLGLSKWKIIPQGGNYNLGKLTFMHGDTVTGGEHMVKQAVINYERSVRFGHYHTYAAYTKNTPLQYINAKTGIAVPCLCTKIPSYGKLKPNRWVQGFNFGYVDKNGFYSDYVPIIINSRVTIHGKTYKG
jgi:metallophosphoesterase superfamily enzyme